MNTMELLNKIFQLCIVPLLSVLTAFLIQFINVKKDELKRKTDNELAHKYLDMLAGTIETCVIATNQTYVDSLKDQNAFDAAAQKEAFNITYTAVTEILSAEAKAYLASIVGDLQKYITEQIEAAVNINKYTPVILDDLIEVPEG